VSLSDTSIRAQVRLEGTADEVVAIFARANAVTNQSHALEIAADGGLWLGIANDYQRIIGTDLRPTNEDVVLQLDVIGDSIRGWAWRADEPMPGSPLFTRQSSALTMGSPGVYYGPSIVPQGTSGTAIYRYIQVATSPIPEPTALVLAVLGGGALVFGTRRRRNVKTQE
jgi:hypothetical protein